MGAKKSVYVTDAARKVIGAVPDRGVSTRICSILMRYQEICNANTPVMPEGCWLATLAALREICPDSTEPTLEILRCLWSRVAYAEAGPTLAASWSVDPIQLANKLSRLGTAELWSIVEVSTRLKGRVLSLISKDELLAAGASIGPLQLLPDERPAGNLLAALPGR